MARLVLHRASLRQFLGPTALYAVACGVALVVAWVFGDAWIPVLFLAGMGVVLLTWRNTRWPDTWSRYLSFGALLLLVCVANRAFYIADYFVTGTQFDEWPFWAQSPQAAVFKGEVIAVLGTLLTLLGWRLCGGMRVSPAIVMERPRQTYRVVQVIYVLALIGLFISERRPGMVAALGQLLPTLLVLGLVGAFLVPMTRFRGDLARLLATIALSVPFVLMASGTGMKENIILATVPAAVMTWRYFHHPLARTGMVAAGLVALALITAYVNLYRSEVWVPQSRGLAISQSVPQDFVEEVRSVGLAHAVGDGLGAFIKRSDGSYAHGWAVSIADDQAFHPKLVFAPLAYVFVPRVLWPGKPLIQQGWEYSGLVFGENYISWSGSSTAAGFYSALYLGLGWPAVVLGALMAGMLLAAMSRLALRFGGPLAAGLYIFSMVPFMLRMNANWTVGVLSGPIIGLVYVLAIFSAARIVAYVIAKSVHTPAASP
jgi:hypothetical protein